MHSVTADDFDLDSPDKANWGAVSSISLGVFALVASEFLPASLLTPMAKGLGVTEGMAGQAVTATAAVALVTSLLVTVVTRGMDRRKVMLGFTAMLVLSNLLVALAPNLLFVLIGRILLGFSIGGFWSLSAAVIMRLVPAKTVPKALGVMFSGVSIATVFTAPIGSYLGDIIGWRNVYHATALLGFALLVVQFATLPSIEARGHHKLSTLWKVLKRPIVSLAMLAILLSFAGHFTLYTYVRPFLETVTGVSANGVAAILFGFGIANVLGNYAAGVFVQKSIRTTLMVMPLLVGAIALTLSAIGGSRIVDTALMAVWGFAFGSVPVGWSTWITRNVADEAESGGGLFVASINLAITLGVSTGGIIYDMSNVTNVFIASGIALLAAAAIASRVRSA